MKILRGVQLADSLNQLQTSLDRFLTDEEKKLNGFELPQLSIGNIRLPPHLETLGIFAVGSPGTGKTQAIAQLIESIRRRPDYRLVCFDRNGEFTQTFYQPHQDLLFNPIDTRSVGWCHKNEPLLPETIAAGIVPEDNNKDKFWTYSARGLLADLYSLTETNAEIWACLSGLTYTELEQLLKGSVTAHIFGSDRTMSGVLATLTAYTRFYRELAHMVGAFSFYNWAIKDNNQSLFLPLFEDAAEISKPLYTLIFELILKGLLSDTRRKMKTAIVIDELGALNELPSLIRLLSEGRKFKVCSVLATQTEAQIQKTYCLNSTRILLQSLATKLIFNCCDYETAQIMASFIGKQERIDEIYNDKNGACSHVTRETFAVMPSEIQFLPRLQGYLVINDAVSPAKVQIVPKSYEKISPALLKRKASNLHSQQKLIVEELKRRHSISDNSVLPVDVYKAFL